MTAAGKDASYTYDAECRRIGKERETIVTVGGEAISNSSTTKYIYLGDTLTEMQIVNVDESVDTFRFTYDATGPMSMTFYGTEYFYLKNAQGDVTGIVNAAGTQVVAYTYDAWGKLLSTTGTMAGSIGTLNPLRYRGYVYDTETGLYYLNSRYYNPETGRFINADGYVSTGQGIVGNNMFAYCGNNPSSRTDPSGAFWEGIGNFVKNVVKKVSSAIKSIFGAKSTTTIVLKEEKSVIPDPYPVTVKYGEKSVTTVASSGDDTRPVSIYQNTVVNDFASSTVGVKANIGNNSFGYSIGLNDLSFSRAITNGDTVQQIAIKVNIQELKLGIEGSTTVKWEGGYKTTYTNISASGWFMAAMYAALTMGQWMPTPNYA